MLFRKRSLSHLAFRVLPLPFTRLRKPDLIQPRTINAAYTRTVAITALCRPIAQEMTDCSEAITVKSMSSSLCQQHILTITVGAIARASTSLAVYFSLPFPFREMHCRTIPPAEYLRPLLRDCFDQTREVVLGYQSRICGLARRERRAVAATPPGIQAREEDVDLRKRLMPVARAGKKSLFTLP